MDVVLTSLFRKAYIKNIYIVCLFVDVCVSMSDFSPLYSEIQLIATVPYYVLGLTVHQIVSRCASNGYDDVPGRQVCHGRLAARVNLITEIHR